MRILFLILFLPTLVLAGVSDNIQVGGFIAPILQYSVNVYQTALIFNSKEHIRNRVIGKIYLKYNTPIDSIQISASTPNGIPSNNSGTPYPFGQYGFKIRITNCDGVNGNPIVFPETEHTPVSIGSNTKIKTGVINTCDILASWDGSDKEVEKDYYSVDFSINLIPNQ